ncbi:aldehyde dehydrogenase family protein [Paenibacillus allorhizosphaerae]|uniref:NADP-dependent glyceraldehyde-3-phosphate dehydrogenase n=1 Tax=Paenibacillus allorhizosphaerae TaxID=2849866 RepID=A0ABM8VAW2_9BACL|nr:aldehyde dehydrogenase family protein [Paenibacillus allorhizosphaerae]CAG7616111.1 NADP-dependent glyceraldehyde-3-phosphate dehydrogenase [Paenibacillus allorhizosphaerae]
MEHYPILIDGRWISTEEKLEVKEKYSGKTIATVSIASEVLVEQAVAAAQTAYRTNALPPYRRYEILKRTSELVLANKQQLGRLIAQEVGKTLKEAVVEVERTAQTLEISAEEAKRIHGEGIPVESSPGAENRLAFTIRVPVGVVCAITPFNVPLNLVAHKVGPALAAGNAVVLKPASVTPLIAVKLAQLFEQAGLPPGYLNLVIGSGSSVGEQLAQDERINLYTFTGSPAVGKQLKQRTGLRKVLLELGSNSAVIVHKDADVELAAGLTVGKSFGNAGQVCISVQRIYVHQDIKERFVKAFVQRTLALRTGDPFDPATDVGPMISEKEAVRAEQWVHEALEAGATLECGGKRDGALFQPTVLSHVKEEMKVTCEELFAPVVGISEYTELDECIERINLSRYGLQAGIFTANLSTAFHAARRIHVGGLIVNDASQFRADLMPYGGVKESGWGKEGPKYAIEEMTEERIVVFNL